MERRAPRPVSSRRLPPGRVLLALASLPSGGQAASAGLEAWQEQCLERHFPESRSDFPVLLNCLGLEQEAVEVGVQAGVHAQGFLEAWSGRRLRLVDKWGHGEEDSGGASFYVDIANIHGADVRRQHRTHCEFRVAEALRAGRAEVVMADSTEAAAEIADGSLDFVYLDARHDFEGVVLDIEAWWRKVRVGGVFAGHDYVDGEFPEGDFFWISALREVLPDVGDEVRVTREQNRFPSFFVVKTARLAAMTPRRVDAKTLARQLYAERSRYFQLWRRSGPDNATGFAEGCRALCGHDCDERSQRWTPMRSAVSTLRPFACGEEQGDTENGACGTELVVDAKAYHDVCLERCSVTCKQRGQLFSAFGDEILSV